MPQWVQSASWSNLPIPISLVIVILSPRQWLFNSLNPSASVNWDSIRPGNSLSPVRRQAITYNYSWITVAEPLGTNFSEIWGKKLYKKLIA